MALLLDFIKRSVKQVFPAPMMQAGLYQRSNWDVSAQRLEHGITPAVRLWRDT